MESSAPAVADTGASGGDWNPSSVSASLASQAVAELSSPTAPSAEPPSPETTAAPPEQAKVEPPSTQQTSPAPTTEKSQDAQWLLDKFGGDINAASAWALETNNRAAAMAESLKKAGIDPQTLQPIAREHEPAPPVEAPPPIDDKAVREHVLGYLGRDPDAVRIVQTFNQNKGRLGQIETTATTLQNDLRVAELRAAIPEIANDSFRASEVKDQIRDLKLQLSDLRTEKRDLAQEQKDLERQHQEISQFYDKGVREFLSKEETKRLETVRYEQATKFHEQQFAQAWPNAIQQAIKDNQIQPDIAEEFKTMARESALAILNADGGPGHIEDVQAFVANVGKRFAALTDRAHRAEAAKYGALATQRAAVPGPTGAAAVAPPTQTPVPETIQSLIQERTASFKDAWKALRGSR